MTPRVTPERLAEILSRLAARLRECPHLCQGRHDALNGQDYEAAAAWLLPRLPHSCEEWREAIVGCAICHEDYYGALAEAEARGKAGGRRPAEPEPVRSTRAQSETHGSDEAAPAAPEPHPLHSHHATPVRDCDRCQDLMDEARALAEEFHKP